MSSSALLINQDCDDKTGQAVEIPLYCKAWSIPHIQPNCLEVVHGKKIAFACNNGFFIGTFFTEDDLELLQVTNLGNF